MQAKKNIQYQSKDYLKPDCKERNTYINNVILKSLMLDNPSDLQQVTIPELIKFSLITTFKI